MLFYVSTRLCHYWHEILRPFRKKSITHTGKLTHVGKMRDLSRQQCVEQTLCHGLSHTTERLTHFSVTIFWSGKLECSDFVLSISEAI